MVLKENDFYRKVDSVKGWFMMDDFWYCLGKMLFVIIVG